MELYTDAAPWQEDAHGLHVHPFQLSRSTIAQQNRARSFQHLGQDLRLASGSGITVSK